MSKRRWRKNWRQKSKRIEGSTRWFSPSSSTFLTIHGTILIWLLEMITSLFCIVFALFPVLFCPPPLHIIVWSTVFVSVCGEEMKERQSKTNRSLLPPNSLILFGCITELRPLRGQWITIRKQVFFTTAQKQCIAKTNENTTKCVCYWQCSQ